jgi:hypothetical protein
VVLCRHCHGALSTAGQPYSTVSCCCCCLSILKVCPSICEQPISAFCPCSLACLPAPL